MARYQKNSHCSYCGHLFSEISWPRTCDNCQQISFINPIPVAVMLVEVKNGLLGIQRAIEPQKGTVDLGFPLHTQVIKRYFTQLEAKTD